MSSRFALCAAVAGGLWLAAAAAGAQAAVVFSQALPPSSPAYISDARHTITYDDFVLEADTLVTGVEWWGTAMNYPGWLGPPLPNPMPVAIEIYESAFVASGGNTYPYPNLNAGPIFAVEGRADWTQVGLSSLGDPIQRFTYTFAEPMRLEGERILWLTVYGTSPNIANAVMWRQSGPGSHWTETIATRSVQPGSRLKLYVARQHTNVAFTLFGTPAAVPESATWALMITGFGLAGAALRRRQREAGASQPVELQASFRHGPALLAVHEHRSRP